MFIMTCLMNCLIYLFAILSPADPVQPKVEARPQHRIRSYVHNSFREVRRSLLTSSANQYREDAGDGVRED